MTAPESALSGQLVEFVRESNEIEGIHRAPTQPEIEAHRDLLREPRIYTATLVAFIKTITGEHGMLRNKKDMDVVVGRYRPPRGGPKITLALDGILLVANEGGADPHHVHVAYEKLHPFMDGNGRSGRALWAWQMKEHGENPFAIPFLRRWYYQTLAASQPRKES